MIIKTAEFVGSFVKLTQCPPPDKPEYAFIGRSNVGKSSLINMLTGRKGLAKVSVTPGKTQTINHFIINSNWYLVDLPGYGYAKVSKENRKKWEIMIQEYLVKRPNLQCVFLLVDSRIPPQQSDLDFANRLGTAQVPFVIVFTKTDDKKFDVKNITAFKTAMLQTWETLPDFFITSAEKHRGKDELLFYIEEVNKQFTRN
ncbi:YihA family ribosome biogenesis GTP-binding protein [Sphingobacteriales bacterium UPWRP_1]|nr:YihA family ribosome biogenesis GTP-binding protein [Sphingobacteriales bacterium TSM_CSS]PSJ71546.1 YihA family ribosome biogenesis GTP-binding protein [Sphingobacteriales bacterium UPWRP_1]